MLYRAAAWMRAWCAATTFAVWGVSREVACDKPSVWPPRSIPRMGVPWQARTHRGKEGVILCDWNAEIC